MEYFNVSAAPCVKKCEAGEVLYGNEYISWSHDADTGELTGAVVKNGSGENLLTTPLYFSIN